MGAARWLQPQGMNAGHISGSIFDKHSVGRNSVAIFVKEGGIDPA